MSGTRKIKGNGAFGKIVQLLFIFRSSTGCHILAPSFLIHSKLVPNVLHCSPVFCSRWKPNASNGHQALALAFALHDPVTALAISKSWTISAVTHSCIWLWPWLWHLKPLELIFHPHIWLSSWCSWGQTCQKDCTRASESPDCGSTNLPLKESEPYPGSTFIR